MKCHPLTCLPLCGLLLFASSCESDKEDTLINVYIAFSTSGSFGVTVGQPFNIAFAGTVINGKGSDYTVNIVPVAGTQPPGVGFSPGQSPALLSGTPTVAGTYTITLQATSPELSAEAEAHDPNESPDEVRVYDTDAVESFTIIVNDQADL
jgi:hypothetical protein